MEALREAKALEKHELLSINTAVEASKISFSQLLKDARKQLANFSGKLDGIIAQWDFPTSVLVPLLCQQYDIPPLSA